MSNRYRHTDWVALRKRLPPSIRADIGEMLAPPKYVLLSFASIYAKEYIESMLGPSIEPNTSYDLVQYKRARRKKDDEYAPLPDPKIH